jgi:hypothetical protein
MRFRRYFLAMVEPDREKKRARVELAQALIYRSLALIGVSFASD